MPASNAAFADKFIDISLASHHWDRQATTQQDFCEVNPGIGIENDDVRDEDGTRFIAMAGVYRNSIRRMSIYALMGYEPIRTGRTAFGLVYGVTTGYAIGLTPEIGILASYQLDDLGVNLILTPSNESTGAYGFAGLQLRYKLKP